MREQLNDDMGQILEVVEAGGRREWKDIVDRILVYKSYWAQCETL
jgi:hypothetical protein